MFHFTIPDNVHAPCTTVSYCYYCISICARSQFSTCIQWIFPNHNILCWFTIMSGILTSQQLIEETLQGAWVSFKVGKPQHGWKTLLPPQGTWRGRAERTRKCGCWSGTCWAGEPPSGPPAPCSGCCFSCVGLAAVLSSMSRFSQ